MVWSRHRRTVLSIAVTVSAVLFFFGTGLEPTAAIVVIAPLPIFVVSVHVSGLAAWVLGFLAFFAGTANSWDYYLTANDVPMPFGLVICLGLSAIFALAVTGFRFLILRRRPLLAAVTAPAIWAGTLFVIANTIPFGIMGTMAWSQTDLPAVLQLASITGVWGIEYLALFVPAAGAAIIVDNNRASKLRTTCPRSALCS
jgi:apolipoprotein N-acyltransferase